MILSARRRRIIRNGVRDLIFRACLAFGVVAGFFWAFRRPDSVPPKTCATGSKTGEAVTECFADSLASTFLPYAIGMGLGAIVGAVIGILLGRLLVGPSRKPARRARRAAGRWMIARYDGLCVACTATIRPGDRIHHARGRTLCAGCG